MNKRFKFSLKVNKILPQSTKKALTLIVAAFLIAGTSTLFSHLSNSSSKLPGAVHQVVLTENGFEPAEISIRQGDTIKFTTTRNKHFWPASNLHPTHEIYSEFDPKHPLDPKDFWSFQFGRIGEWKYHDHLSPFYTGTIKVESATKSAISGCSNDQAAQDCWAAAVEKTINFQGLDTGFDLISQIYQENPKGAESCHALVHIAGKAAFKLFSTNHNFQISPKAAFCNYGFYHGFMESLVLSGKNLKEASKFCEYIDSKLKKTAPNSGLQCYHGIGHGTVGSHDPSLWGNEHAMIEPALRLCENAISNDQELFRCVSGVYNGIGNFYVTGEYKLKANQEDPFWICREQTKESYIEACYGNFHPTIMWLSQQSFPKAAKYVEAISETKIAVNTIRYVVGDFARLNLNSDNFSQNIADCRALQDRLRWPCLMGFVTGLMDHGRPDQEYVAALRYCHSQVFDKSEQTECYKYTFPYLATMYSHDKYDLLCRAVDPGIKDYCRAS